MKCISNLNEVKQNILDNTTVPFKNVRYVVGDITKTYTFPEKIAILRLDTDLYESTTFELANFYNLVSPGGYIISNDYGHWKGCRKAVDDFLEKHPEIKINYIDYTGIYFIKPYKYNKIPLRN
jgi:O-methyltransferase